MSQHPNVVLLLSLKPDGLSRKTHRNICKEAGVSLEEIGGPQITIGGHNYFCEVMESDYNESMQIAADEGDIVIYDMVTYGYGERVPWAGLIARQQALQEWADGVCARHDCTDSFFVTANYW